MSDKAWNWRDEYEEKDRDGDTVLDVVRYNGRVFGYAYHRNGEHMTLLVTRLICKPKPPTYRPWTRDEVPVGTVVRFNGDRYLITACDVTGMCARGYVPYAEALSFWTMDDGTPCGVEVK